MKHLPRISWILMTFLLLALPACGKGGSTATPTNADLVYTQIASTALVLQTQTAQAMPTATNTPVPSATEEATVTPLVTNTPAPTVPSSTKVPTLQSSCNNSEGVADVTYPDGALVAAGEIMDKTWTLKNTGTCAWTKNFALAYAYGGDGTNWQNATSNHISNPVKPGETIDITVTLKAPNTKGTYGAFFRMMDDKGYYFGKIVWISIKVE